jgi:DDT domain/WSTF, HB1, Itc1p, MBD9 motif 1
MGKKASPGGAPGRRSSRHSDPAPGNGAAPTNGAAASTPSSGGPRRTGRKASTPAPEPASAGKDTIQSGAKTAPARTRRPSSTTPAAVGGSGSKATPAAAATTGGKAAGQKRSRLSRSAGPSNGSESRSLRKRGSVSFKETSDVENEIDYSRRESSGSEEEAIDDTVYEVPAEAILPEITVLELAVKDVPVAPEQAAAPAAPGGVEGAEEEEGKEGGAVPAFGAAPAPVAPPAPQQLIIPTAAMGDLTAAYALIRSFSWQLRLSPFSFEDFCAAMTAPQPTVLMDELHVCVLRALAFDEVEEEREERKLDLGMLDHLTWPCYVWEMLRLTEDPLAKLEWSQRLLERLVPTAAVTATITTAASAAIRAEPEAASMRQSTPGLVTGTKTPGGGYLVGGAPATTEAGGDRAQQQGPEGNTSGAEAVENQVQPMEIDGAVPEAPTAPLAGLVAAVIAEAVSLPAPATAPSLSLTAAAPAAVKNPSPSALASPAPRPRAFEPVDIAQMDQELAAANAQTTDAPAADGAAAVTASVPEPSVVKMFSGCGPGVHQQQTEYYSLPVETKASVLSRLCDHLLDCTTFRAEIDRREEEGLYVGGRGDDEGGFFSMLPEKERDRIAKLVRAGKDDQLPVPETEACVICGVGGSLMVCDGCPAAFHHRCIGERVSTNSSKKQDKPKNNEETPKVPPPEPWYCPECILGGRGETAGVRIPVAARNKWKQPLHIINGSVVRTQLPAVQSQGRHIKELSTTAPATLITGPAAAETIATSRKVKDADEIPLPSSFDAFKEPPKTLPVNKLPEGAPPPPTGPEAYLNRYRNAWTASSIALRATIEENKRKKVKGKLTIPTGTCGRLVVPKLPEQMPLSRFPWVQMQGRPGGRTTTRCGKCHTCLKTSLRKGCLNPISRPLEDVLNTSQQADTSK